MYYIVASYISTDGTISHFEAEHENPTKALEEVFCYTHRKGVTAPDSVQLIVHPEDKHECKLPLPGTTRTVIRRGIAPIFFYWTGSTWSRSIQDAINAAEVPVSPLYDRKGKPRYDQEIIDMFDEFFGTKQEPVVKQPSSTKQPFTFTAEMVEDLFRS